MRTFLKRWLLLASLLAIFFSSIAFGVWFANTIWNHFGTAWGIVVIVPEFSIAASFIIVLALEA